jgi:hypothetical protein
MRDRGLIVTGLVVFLVVITFPAWYNVAAGTPAPGPDPRLPETEKVCVRPAGQMRLAHMQVVNDWRDRVVREHVRFEVAPDGRRHEMSLTRTCLGCHRDKAEFCDRCHNYAGVTPYCWECHVNPATARGGTR